jgi:hypothetical protein
VNVVVGGDWGQRDPIQASCTGMNNLFQLKVHNIQRIYLCTTDLSQICSQNAIQHSTRKVELYITKITLFLSTN